VSIPGLTLTPLTLIPDDRGYLLELLRADSPGFTGFGQVYLSATYPGVVKAWHRHRKQTDQFVCVAGAVKVVVLWEEAQPVPGSGAPQWHTYEKVLSAQTPQRLTIPPGLYHGWQALGPETALVLNCCDQPYNYEQPDEERVAAHGVLPYDWLRRPDR
jgi:dTDP-4-dehydrorhamnose 3,5-epimerase